MHRHVAELLPRCGGHGRALDPWQIQKPMPCSVVMTDSEGDRKWTRHPSPTPRRTIQGHTGLGCGVVNQIDRGSERLPSVF